MEAKEWGQGNECQNLAGRITLMERRWRSRNGDFDRRA
jgi:hypothetical protein